MQSQSFETMVTVSRDAQVSAGALWQVLSDLALLPEWAPGIDGATVTSAQTAGVGAIREVETAQFGTITHRITDWQPDRLLAYETDDSGPFSRTLTTYQVTETGTDAATVAVTLAFEIKPGAMDPEKAKAVLHQGLTATLQALEMRARVAVTA